MFFKRLSFQGIDYTFLGPVVNNDSIYDTDSIFLSFFLILTIAVSLTDVPTHSITLAEYFIKHATYIMPWSC